MQLVKTNVRFYRRFLLPHVPRKRFLAKIFGEAVTELIFLSFVNQSKFMYQQERMVSQIHERSHMSQQLQVS